MKKSYLFLGIILNLVLVVLILLSYYNVVILVENWSPNDNCIDIQISSDNKVLVNDTAYYSIITPNYKWYFSHVSWGKHLIKVKSDIAGIEKSELLNFSLERSYLFVDYEYRQINITNSKTGDSTKITNKKQFRIGLTTKMPGLQ